MEKINALNEMYKIVSMGIIGIEEVRGHIKEKEFANTMVDAKRKYNEIKVNISKMLEKYGEKPAEVNVFVKMFNDLYTNMQLANNDDSKIAKMLVEGTNKGILKLEEILNKDLEKKTSKEAQNLLELLEFQISKWKCYL